MPKLVQKSGYIKAGKATGYMRYIATRERVEKLDGSGPVTKNQQKLIADLLRDFPDTRELHEYADYVAAPTFGNASALITMALDMNADEVQNRDGYMKYIATRPRVERHGEDGLFSSAASVSLDAALKELEAHEGNVWTLIYSLRREDAERLGYDNADAWRTLIRSKQVELANAMKIPPDKFRWYAAFHDEGTHPHIHMMVWSNDPKQGYLTKDGIAAMRSQKSMMTENRVRAAEETLKKHLDNEQRKLLLRLTDLHNASREEASLCGFISGFCLAEGIRRELDEFPRFSIVEEDEERARKIFEQERSEQHGETQGER